MTSPQTTDRITALETRLAALEKMISAIPGGGVQITAQGALRIVVGGACTMQVGTNYSLAIGGACATSIGTNYTVSANGAHALSVGGAYTVAAGGAAAVSVAKDLAIEAGDAITVKTGSAQFTEKKNGDILLSGSRIDIRGSGDVSVKAASNVVMKGSKILQN